MILVGLAAFLTPLFFSWTLTYLATRVAPRIGLVDRPNERKTHLSPTPLGGGIAVFLAVSATLLLVLCAGYVVQASPYIAGIVPDLVRSHAGGVVSSGGLLGLILATAAVQLFLGLVDDFRGLGAGLRLVVETLLAILLVWNGVRLDILPGWNWLTWPLTVLWIVGLTNALNLLDNMDGLSGGVAAIASAFFAAVSYLVGDLFVAGCFVVVLGGTLGFLRWNWPPARIFLGDAGSNFLGFVLGVLTVVATFKTEAYSHVTLLAPLCIAAVPIYDTLSVMILRLSQGRSPFQADRQHLSHRLVELGFDPQSAVLLILLLTIATGLGGLSLYFVRPEGAAFVLSQVVCMLAVVGTLEMVAQNKVRNGKRRDAD